MQATLCWVGRLHQCLWTSWIKKRSNLSRQRQIRRYWARSCTRKFAPDASFAPSVEVTTQRKTQDGPTPTHVRAVIRCEDCHKPRAIACKLLLKKLQSEHFGGESFSKTYVRDELDCVINDDSTYVCGALLFPTDHQLGEHLQCNPKLECTTPVELRLYQIASATLGSQHIKGVFSLQHCALCAINKVDAAECATKGCNPAYNISNWSTYPLCKPCELLGRSRITRSLSKAALKGGIVRRKRIEKAVSTTRRAGRKRKNDAPPQPRKKRVCFAPSSPPEQPLTQRLPAMDRDAPRGRLTNRRKPAPPTQPTAGHLDSSSDDGHASCRQRVQMPRTRARGNVLNSSDDASSVDDGSPSSSPCGSTPRDPSLGSLSISASPDSRPRASSTPPPRSPSDSPDQVLLTTPTKNLAGKSTCKGRRRVASTRVPHVRALPSSPISEDDPFSASPALRANLQVSSLVEQLCPAQPSMDERLFHGIISIRDGQPSVDQWELLAMWRLLKEMPWLAELTEATLAAYIVRVVSK